MCTRPVTMFSKAAGREITVACGTCDKCVAARRKDWVARAMAEKAMHPQTFVVALTYSDESQFTRDGAAFFRYKDVRIFLATLRENIKRKTGETASLRFLAAGEQGSKNGRCHWHIVLFSDVDLLTIGEFRASWGVVTEAKDIIAPPMTDMPRMWTMWQHGFVQVQVPDEGGMHYALSYALKDQFNAMRSEGSARVSKSEAFATGVFRPSKSPPIGASYIDQEIYRMYCSGNIEPKTHIQVPGMRGFWYPKGLLRERYLTGMRRINDSVRAQTGRDCAQWWTLVKNCSESETDLETLGVNEVQNDETEEFEREVKLRQREIDADRKKASIIRQCGRKYPCIQCIRGLPDAELQKLGLYFDEEGVCRIQGTGEGWEQSKGIELSGINKQCGLKETALRKWAFPQSA